MIDQLASTVSLARVMLDDAHPSKEKTEVNTASLRLVLEAFIELGGGMPSRVRNPLPTPSPQATAEAARRTVAGRIATFDAEDPKRG